MAKKAGSKRTTAARMPGTSYAASTSNRRGTTNARRVRSAARGATAKQKTSSQ